MTALGVSGTRQGMTERQSELVLAILETYHPGELHHGDCIGVDAEAHAMATDLGIKTVVHPPKKETYRAYCEGDVILPEDDYLLRNNAIIEAADLMLCVPSSYTEQVRGSGTWQAIRQCRKVGQTTYIIYPDGSTDRF